MGVCGNAINIFAFVTMPDGLPVGSAELLDQEDNLLDLSASDGSLDTEIDLNMVQSLYLNIPSDDIYNGVSTFDLVIITKHILGMQAFDSPYQYWAADVNGSKTVTTLDMVYIQKVILGINTSFPVQKNWISYFDTGNAQAWAQSESMNCQNLQSGDELSIKAIKLGDVNFSAVPE
jgi:hypothetical protein